MNAELTGDLSSSFAIAQVLVGTLGGALNAAVEQSASVCTRNGRLDAALLDEHQGICYELALAYTDLLVVRVLVQGGAHGSELDARLALTFVCEAITAILARLEGIHIAADLRSDLLQKLVTGEELRRLRREVVRPGVLAALGEAVADSSGELADVALSEQTIMARDAFRRFAADVIAPLAEKIHREDLTVPETILRPMRDMGVFGLAIPEEFGGSAVGHYSTVTMIAVTEALSEASLAAGGSLITRPEILSRALLAGGTEQQKAHWLPRIASGDPLCAIAITEPDYGSDVASLTLRGTRVQGGWRLNGAKTWCTFAGKAGLLMVVARTDPDRSLGRRGLSVLLVEKPAYDGHAFTYLPGGDGGKLQGRAIPTIGYRGMHSFDLMFEDFFVPAANVIGGEAGLGRGFYLTMAGMTGGRIQTAGRALGLMRAALNEAIRYAKVRKVFNAPLLDFPLTRIKIATMAARFAACRRFAYVVGEQLDQGAGSMEASAVKLLACRSAEIVSREAMQIHGGIGYAEETAVSRHWVDARVLSIFEGAEETLALKVIARSLLESAARL